MLAPNVLLRAEKRVGQTLSGKWHLERMIGVGGMAAVYEATHRNLNRVAIKLLHPELSLNSETRERFLQEGYAANKIAHPGAVQVLDDDVTDEGLAFLVMELLQGESLDERMRKQGGSLGAREALGYVEQLLEVLEAAHEKGVIHRDIKPDNLFLTELGQLKVLDFGIARLHRSSVQATEAGSFMGTPAFCAPEQARGRWDEVDERSDLFSVGATLFMMLSGVHVHEADTPSEQLALAVSAAARSLRSVYPHAPAALVDLVDRALQYEKEKRFRSAKDMRARVQAVMAQLPEVSEPYLGRKRSSAHVLPDLRPPRAFSWKQFAVMTVSTLVLTLILIWLGRKPEALDERAEESSASVQDPSFSSVAAPSVSRAEEEEKLEPPSPSSPENSREPSPEDSTRKDGPPARRSPPGGGLSSAPPSAPSVAPPTEPASEKTSTQGEPAFDEQELFDRRY